MNVSCGPVVTELFGPYRGTLPHRAVCTESNFLIVARPMNGSEVLKTDIARKGFLRTNSRPN